MSGIIGSAGSKSGVIGTTELDYEEGTWTVVLKGNSNSTLTTNTQSGKYTKIGNLVYASGYISVSSLNGAGGACYIQGWPFSSSSGTDQQGGTVLRLWNAATTASENLGIQIEQNSKNGYIYIWDSGTGTSYFQTSGLSADGAISFCVTYTMSN
jgi:hypothetical protein